MKNFIKFLTCVILASSVGCHKDDGARLSDADKLFRAGEYEQALALYERLVDKYGPLARVGAGWSRIRLHRYDDAAVDFAFADTAGGADGMGGWSFSLWTLGDLTGAIQKAGTALNLSPNWTLRLDPRVDAQHLLWIQSASYYELGQYASCVNTIRLMSGQSAYNPNLSDPAIAEELAAKLQSLGSALGKAIERLEIPFPTKGGQL